MLGIFLLLAAPSDAQPLGDLVVHGVVTDVQLTEGRHALTTVKVMSVLRGTYAGENLAVDTIANPVRWKFPEPHVLVFWTPAVEGEEVILACDPHTQEHADMALRPQHGHCIQSQPHGDFFRRVDLPDGRSVAAESSVVPMATSQPPDGLEDFTLVRLDEKQACGTKFSCNFRDPSSPGWTCPSCTDAAASWTSFLERFTALAADPSTRGAAAGWPSPVGPAPQGTQLSPPAEPLHKLSR